MKGIMRIAAVMAMSLLMLTTNLIAEESKVENVTPDIVGKTYLFDYGEYAYDITITSDKSLHWKLVKGSFEGLKSLMVFSLSPGKKKAGISFIM